MGFEPPAGLMAAHTIVFYALLSMNVGFCRLVKVNLVFFSDTVFISSKSSFIDADTTENLHACQKCIRTDGRGQTAFQLYIVEDI